jgi:fructose-1,6-bisphosphatase I
MGKTHRIEATDTIPVNLLGVIGTLADVAVDLARIIARGPLAGEMGAEVGQNTGGDHQKALDVIADDMFADALRGGPGGGDVRWYASEEQDEVVELNPGGHLALAIDPLDGSSNIDVNVSIGTIFSIFEAKAEGNASFLRTTNEQIAGGYVIYGPQTCLVVSFGQGTAMFLLDPDSQQFVLVNPNCKVPESSNEFAINASNYRHWPKPVRAFIDDLIAGDEGPREANFNMRWVASLVAETHRILTRGGVFLYPGDDRDGYARGRLRMIYECAPIAMLIEQAGGGATDGSDAILGQAAEELHGRTPFVFGSADMVSRVTAYHDLPENEVSALFGKRGLFRS